MLYREICVSKFLHIRKVNLKMLLMGILLNLLCTYHFIYGVLHISYKSDEPSSIQLFNKLHELPKISKHDIFQGEGNITHTHKKNTNYT